MKEYSALLLIFLKLKAELPMSTRNLDHLHIGDHMKRTLKIFLAGTAFVSFLSCSNAPANRNKALTAGDASEEALEGGLELTQPPQESAGGAQYFKLEVAQAEKLCDLPPADPDSSTHFTPPPLAETDPKAKKMPGIEANPAKLYPGKIVHEGVSLFKGGKLHRVGRLPEGQYFVTVSLLDEKNVVIYRGLALTKVDVQGRGKAHVELLPVADGLVITTGVKN
jgi:hypothetical protein